MALDFPANPTNGQTFGSYIYDSSIPGWRNVNSSEGIGLQFKSGLVPVVPTSVNVTGGAATVSANGLVTMTNATGISLNGVFTSAYKNYRMMIEVQTASAVPGGDVRLRAAGTDVTSNYSWFGYRAINWAGAAGLNGTTSGSSWAMWDTYSGASVCAATQDIFRPGEAVPTKMIGSGYHISNSLGASYYSGHHGSSTAYDGLTYATSVAVTGTFQILGYAY